MSHVQRIGSYFAVLMMIEMASEQVFGVDEPAGGKATITGKVVDADGNAVAEAKVMLKAKAAKSESSLGLPEASPMGGDKKATISETTTDSDGKFTMSNLDPGSY